MHAEKYSQLESGLEEHGARYQEMASVHRNLEASHAELCSKHFDGHQMHVENYSQLESRLEEHRETHHNILEAERREWAQKLQNQCDLLGRQISVSLEHETLERNVQVEHVIRRLDASTTKLDQVMASNGAREHTLAREHEVKDELRGAELNYIRNSIQNLGNTVAEQQNIWENKCNQLCESLNQEFASKLSTLQAQISEERNQQVAELRADYIQAILQEHQNRLDDAAEQRREISKAIRNAPSSLTTSIPTSPSGSPMSSISDLTFSSITYS